jgi:hypothetical protein
MIGSFDMRGGQAASASRKSDIALAGPGPVADRSKRRELRLQRLGSAETGSTFDAVRFTTAYF